MHLEVSRVDNDVATLHTDIAKLERELGHLTAAVAEGGGNIPTLLSAIRAREERREEFIRLSRERPRIVSLGSNGILADLQDRLADWRSLLNDDTTRARALLKQLIVGRLTMTPNRQEQ